MNDQLRFVEVGCLTDLNDPASWMYEAIASIERANAILIDGTDEQVSNARELMANRRNQADEAQQWVLAVLGPDDSVESVAGWAQVRIPVHGDHDKVFVYACVRPESRRQGIGSALLAWCEGRARQAGRPLLFIEAPYGAADDHEPYLLTAEGAQVPCDATCVAFPRARGFTVAHAAHRSVLDVPMDPELAQTLLNRTLPSTSGYRLHTWAHQIPEEWTDSFARLREVFSRDAPRGSDQWDEEIWDVARVQSKIDEIHDQGRTVLITAAEDLSTSQLAGFTEFRWPDNEDCQAVEQFITVVTAPHRGHRLGMWMKLVNLAALMELNPRAKQIHTDNAQENEHMLNINSAMGFRLNGGIVLMKKTQPV